MPASHAPFGAFNRTANPLIRGILRSPLHRALSGRLLLITVTGRRSGRRHTFPVGYERDGDRVRIEVSWPERKRWWRNLRDGAPVEVTLEGRRRTGFARAEGDEDSGVVVEVQLEPQAPA